MWPWTVTLTLCRHGWIMTSAHRLTEANIWPKLKKKTLQGYRRYGADTKFTCDLDLELAWLTYWFCTSTHCGEHLTKGFRRYGADKKVLRKDRRTDRLADGQMDRRTDRQTERRTDEGHFYNPPSASRPGINKCRHTCFYLRGMIHFQGR